MSVVAVESYLFVSECGVVAATALLVFDYILTLRNEVEWLFGTRWTFARIHFTSLRYLPFLVLALSIPTSRVLPPSKTIYCGSLGMATNAMYYLCIILAELMLVIRTYALWRSDKRILFGMCTFAVLCLVATIVPSETTLSQDTNSVYKALNCAGVQGSVATVLQFTGLVLYETGMLGLNWIAFRRMRKQNSPGQWITTLYRDGMMYMATILLVNAAYTQYADTLNPPQLVIHSILTTRIFFNLKEISQQEQENPHPTSLSEFHAVPQIADTLFNSSMGSSSSGGGTHISA